MCATHEAERVALAAKHAEELSELGFPLEIAAEASTAADQEPEGMSFNRKPLLSVDSTASTNSESTGYFTDSSTGSVDDPNRSQDRDFPATHADFEYGDYGFSPEQLDAY